MGIFHQTVATTYPSKTFAEVMTAVCRHIFHCSSVHSVQLVRRFGKTVTAATITTTTTSTTIKLGLS